MKFYWSEDFGWRTARAKKTDYALDVEANKSGILSTLVTLLPNGPAGAAPAPAADEGQAPAPASLPSDADEWKRRAAELRSKSDWISLVTARIEQAEDYELVRIMESVIDELTFRTKHLKKGSQ